MPEMKGRSLEELDEIFAAGVSARKFSSYQCVIKEVAMQDIKSSEAECGEVTHLETVNAGESKT
jgi:hypothetical protein